MAKPGQSATVKKMKEDIAKARSKRSPKQTPLQPPEVVQPTEQPLQPPEVVNPTTSKSCAEHIFNDTLYNYVLNNEKRFKLKKEGLTDQQIDDNLGHLLDAYAAEGLTPDPDRLPAEVLQLARRVL